MAPIKTSPARTVTSRLTLGSYWRFLVAGLLQQAQTGALLPSQRFLISRMLAPIPASYNGRIIELGPGNGALTLRLAAKCPAARILACEINPVLARDLDGSLAAAGLNGRVQVMCSSAQRLLGDMVRCGAEAPDFIISGIPLGNLDRERVFNLVERIHGALRKGGLYIQFQYSLIDRKKIKATFARLRTEPVLLNIPPAVVYYAQK